MTPQELLQQQRRQQVDFNLSLPSVTSREIQAGQYSVAVQRTPKAEQTTLGRLADALGKVNPIIAKYGEAQIAENERQILDVQQKIASMDPAEKERLLARPEAEVNLSKAFRTDYELNPVATYRAKMLLGAEKNVEFNAVLADRIEAFKTKFLRENGDKPSYSQISKEINEITDEYIKNDPALTENAIMRTGFLQEASVNINKLKQQLPSDMAEEHKKEVLMPNLASSLARMQNAEDIDLARLRSHWEASSSSLSPSEQMQVIDDTLGILNFNSSEKELDNGIAFLENMRLAGAKVGNQALDADGGRPMSDSYYFNKIDDLEDMREAVVAKERKQADIRVEAKKREYTDKYRTASKAGYGENSTDIFDDYEKERQKIERLEGVSEYEKEELFKALRDAFNDGFREISDTIDALEAESARSTASPQAMSSRTRSMLVTYVQRDLEGQKYKGVDVSKALIGERVQALDPNDPYAGDTFETYALGPELRKILNDKNQQFLTERAEAMELVARLDPGEEITLGDKVYTIEEGENIERKRNTILSEHMTERMGVLMAESKDDVDDLLASAVKKTKEEGEVAAEEAARLGETADKKANLERASELLKLKPPTSGELGEGRAKRGEILTGRLSGAGIKPDSETVVNVPTMLDAVEFVLKNNPHTPEKTKIIEEEAMALYARATPGIKAKLKEALEFSKRSRTSKIKAEREAAYANRSEEVFRARRLLKGYTPEEVKKALSVGKGEPGYLEEGARIPDPKIFFRAELLGEFQGATRIPEGGFKAAALLKDATDEDVAEIAKLLEVDTTTFKKRQEQYKQAREGKPPKAAAPAEAPVVEPPVETPAPEPVKKERKPKALPPIPEGPSFENYKPRQRSRAEQLELPLDTAKPAVGSVDKATTDLVKRFEGKFQAKAFWDNKQYSIGFGTKADEGETITLAQAEKALAKELAGHAKKVDSYDKIYNWTPNERSALISFTFNLGNKGLDDLTNKGKRTKQEIAEKILLYNKETVNKKKQFSKGLDNRRKAEQKLFLTK